MKLQGRINNSSYSIFWMLLFWAVLNMFSAYYTGLAHDEAYYWVFSQHLDWGYLDHPPVVPVLIWMGQLLFDNTLGVRFFNILLNVGSLFLLWKICEAYGRDFLLFTFLYLGLVTFHVYSFIVVPDAPLLAGCILYFWVFKKYLKEESIVNSLLLAIAIAFMIYSKYHGFLVVLFTIIAVPKILFKKSFWLIALACIILLLPHIVWQIKHGLPTLEYHFLGRGNLAYNINFTTNYILGLLLITGPLLGFILWYAVFKVRTQNDWERALKVTVFGFACFFFLASFRSKIEPNWNSPLLIPLFILSFKYLIHQHKLKKWSIVLGGISLVLAFSLRVYAANDFVYEKLSPNLKLKNEFHLWEEWALDIRKIAGGKPIVFMSSYQMASKYAFYARETSYSYDAVSYRKNQYNLWDIEEHLQGEKVLIVSKPARLGFLPVETTIGNYYYAEVENFRSYNKVKIELLTKNSSFESGRSYPLSIKLTNRYPSPITFKENLELPVNMVLSIFQHKKLIEQQELPLPIFSEPLKPKESVELEIPFRTPAIAGDYYMYISLKPGWLDPGINSHKLKLKIN